MNLNSNSSLGGENETPENHRRGRKGHNKSRRGCFNCKQARKKCKENRPACDYCAHRNLQCRWPELQVVQAPFMIAAKPLALPKAQATVNVYPLQTYNMISNPVSNTLDFRLLNHFIESAYPHQPAGNESLWKHEIPCISSNFDYLLHAILALSASDIASRTNDTSLTLTALTYRTRSVSALNSAVNSGITSSEAGNAMLATCFALLYQSTLLMDGLSEYMSFIRGCVSIGAAMASKGYSSIFTGMFGDEQMKALEPRMLEMPLTEAGVVRDACRSLEKMGALCVTKVEKEMLGLLLSMARDLVTSSRDAYITLRKIYGQFSYHMSHCEFREFTDSENRVCQLLQAHFVALQLVMTPITRNAEGAWRRGEEGETVHWLENIHRRIPGEMRGYYQWTLCIEGGEHERKMMRRKDFSVIDGGHNET